MFDPYNLDVPAKVRRNCKAERRMEGPTLGAVAVGNRVAPVPPHRSQRVELPHWAPTSSPPSKPLERPRMLNANIRKPSLCYWTEPLPVHAMALASSPQRFQPEPHDFGSERVQAPRIGRNGMIGVVAHQDTFQPTPLRRNRSVHATAHGRLEITQSPANPTPIGLSSKHEPTTS